MQKKKYNKQMALTQTETEFYVTLRKCPEQLFWNNDKIYDYKMYKDISGV